jgi:hypothetical protein
MSELNFYNDRIAAQQIAERVARSARILGPRRPRGRHALAHHLQNLAARLDA